MTKKTTGFDLAAGFGLASLHAGVTLWYRLPMFASAGSHQAEMTRMVSEKTSAMVEGMLGAQVEAMRLVGAAASGRLNFDDMAGAPVAITAAGMKPAFRSVKANSKRLHRKGSKPFG